MKFQVFWGLFCKKNSTLTSFGKWCMKHESNNLISRSTFHCFGWKTKKNDLERFLGKIMWILLKVSNQISIRHTVKISIRHTVKICSG